MGHLNRLAIVLVLLLSIAQVIYWYPMLPDEIPSHFDGDGNVVRAMNKVPFFLLMEGVNLLFLLGAPILASCLPSFPDSIISVPNKEYWLTPERRMDSLSDSGSILTTIGWCTSLFLIGLIHLSITIATKQRESIYPEFAILMVAYLGLVFWMVGWLMYRFRIPSGENRTANESRPH